MYKYHDDLNARRRLYPQGKKMPKNYEWKYLLVHAFAPNKCSDRSMGVKNKITFLEHLLFDSNLDLSPSSPPKFDAVILKSLNLEKYLRNVWSTPVLR